MGVRGAFRYGRIVGVDLSVASLSEAREIYDCVYQTDGEHLPFPDESFDMVYSSHAFSHVPRLS